MLLIEPDAVRRAEFHAALSSRGVPVVAATRVADVERWPSGDIVVTDVGHLTPWWKSVGATHVVLLADSRVQGIGAQRDGASAWIARSCAPAALATLIVKLQGTLPPSASAASVTL